MQQLQHTQPGVFSIHEMESGLNLGPAKRSSENNSSSDIIEITEDTTTIDCNVILFIIIYLYFF